MSIQQVNKNAEIDWFLKILPLWSYFRLNKQYTSPQCVHLLMEAL